MRTVRPACAKLNLGLWIQGRRPDGYHDIRSVFQEITLHDDLRFHLREGSGRINLECDTDLPQGPGNLVWDAARLFLDISGLRLDVEISLQKNIPARAGLGGGSSDAACTLKTLAEMTGMDDMDLHEPALQLGSDVPFFISGGSALVSGRGERILPLKTVPFHAVLIHPEVRVSTPGAYAMWDESPFRYLTNSNMIEHDSASSAVWHEGKPFPHDLRNDFLPLLEERIPEIAEVAGFLRTSPCSDWGLSGSGPTFYVLFRTAEEAVRFSEKLRWNFSTCRTADTAGASSNG